MNEKNTFVAWLGFKGTPDFLKSRAIGGFVGVLVLLFTLTVFAFAAIGLVKALSLYAFGDSTEDPSAAIRYIGLLLVGLLGAPFVAWQAIVRQKQADIAEDVLFNEKLNDANNDLHSRYQETEWKRKDGYVHVWKDDIIRRNGAIDRLEALADERHAMAPRIARMLCVYLREMTRDYPAEKMPDGLDSKEIRSWAHALKVKRSDMETAAQVLGRLHILTQVPAKDLDIDLTGVNLQAMQLDGLNFEHAKMNEAALDGACLDSAKLNGVQLVRATLNYADLDDAQINDARLYRAKLNGAMLNRSGLNRSVLTLAELNMASLLGATLNHAELKNAKLNDAFLNYADLKHTKLNWAQLNGADIRLVTIDGATDFTNVTAKGAALKSANLKDVLNLDSLVTSAFGDGSVILPGHIQPLVKNKWPVYDLNLLKYHKEWERFKKDPDAYIPPQLRKE